MASALTADEVDATEKDTAIQQPDKFVHSTPTDDGLHNLKTLEKG